MRMSDEALLNRLALHHYLGLLPKIGETVWYVATWRGHARLQGHLRLGRCLGAESPRAVRLSAREGKLCRPQ